ncbi:MAG TPA: DUF1549 and DUF1553 domain-containing protein, partial [Planctomycetaceae bacterium]|nr:DUF1549 and DUF1553 domain-containing protein [Planctomycetaceae bacterium]
TYDLHGLPPTYQHVVSFINDSDPAAYSRLVERLLDSPRYGERWARHWLDVIHFADTHGFEHDVFRQNAWRYRDYVIRSLNEETPWQDFIRQQLAADVFSPDRSDLIAGLGFLGAGPFDLSTASTAPVTFDYMDRDDMVTQTMSAFVSTTANCARCHAHKFDPVSQEDYYSLQAVFAGVGKGDREYDPDPQIHRQRLNWKTVLAAVNANDRAKLLSSEYEQLVANWESHREGNTVEWNDLSIEVFVSTDGADLEKLEDGSIRAGGTRPDVDTYSLTATTELNSITGVRLDVLADDTLPMRGPGRQDNGNLHLNEVEIQFFPAGSAKPQRLAIARATADFDQSGWTIAHALDGDPKTAWGIHPEVGKSHYAVFELKEAVPVKPGDRLVVVLKQRHGGGHLIGRCKLSATDGPPELAVAIPKSVTAALAVPKGERSLDQQLIVAAHALKLTANAELARLPAPAKVYAVSTSIQRGTDTGSPLPVKEVHLLTRGDIGKPAEPVTPGALSTIEQLEGRFTISDPHNEAQRRAALADWIASPDNPLTWRSIANRVWQFHFGTGLCDTPSDFGRMGGTPSHPELLDWLACELRDSGGSLKHLHRLILASETYRQASRNRSDAALVDGENRLLWRFKRNRLDAESFYDSVLQVSGRLDLEMGGPGVQHFTLSPGQQETPKVHYDQFDWSRPEAGRRAIYRVVWRGIPNPLFESLDFPDLGLLAPQRSFSVSALQSLTLWNHPFVLHHCDVTSTRLTETSPAEADQVREAFQSILLRDPTDGELREFVQYRHEFGLAAAIRLLFNSNEFLFVN